MRKIYTLIFFVMLLKGVSAQDFNKDLASAKTSYASGDLSGARFAMEQMLADVDLALGNEILKLLPPSLGTLMASVKDDHVTAGSGSATGLFVQRSYSTDARTANLNIMNNSPMIASINLILNTPLVGAMMRNENQKVIKIQGYKSVLQKNNNGDKTGYQLQIPLTNTLVTLQLSDTTEDEITQMGGSIPLAKIAQIAQ